MPEIPDEMMSMGRESDKQFDDDEWLYRRVPHTCWSSDRVEVDALGLPDMSVNRQRYGPPEWVRLVSEECWDWGVIGFRVKDIPDPLIDAGVHKFHFKPVHKPLRRNYPHSEVQAHYVHLDNLGAEKHVDRTFLEKEEESNLYTLFTDVLQLRWRNQLRKKCRIVIQAGEGV